tara:strand:- start:129 stop:599 length:471 start_codon:yes stop_codon:yes gene_type:complete
VAEYKKTWVSEPWIGNFGVKPIDPGYIYIFENDGKYKIGKSINPAARIKTAKTWLPDMNVVGIKPFWNVSRIERLLHVGMSISWYDREWFEPLDESYLDTMTGQFKEFYDEDINRNSVDFIYWYNSSGMAEFAIDLNYQKVSVKKFMRTESSRKKK